MYQSKVDEALECFGKGNNCAQAILATYCEDFGLDKETAMKVACGFGGGMGRMQETCGAVTASFMALGLKYGKSGAEDPEARDRTYALVREYAALFKERNNTIKCLDLLGVNFLEGDLTQVMLQVKDLCPKYVKDAAEVLEPFLYE